MGFYYVLNNDNMGGMCIDEEYHPFKREGPDWASGSIIMGQKEELYHFILYCRIPSIVLQAFHLLK